MSNRRANRRPRKSVVALTGAAALMALLTACNGTANGAASVSGNGTASGSAAVSGTADGKTGGSASVSGTAAGDTSDGNSSSDNTSGGGTGTEAPSTSTGADGDGAPSACRPANYTTTIAPGPASAGHSHFQVTLTAAPGYDPCRLAGSPTDVKFSSQGSQNGITAGTYGPQDAVVTFGPGNPVHFDIQVPNDADGTPADEVAFTLRTPDGVIPGEGSVDGSLTVADGTVIGPVQAGA
ncbi:DUF4232 domain-containing protein [Streptomyces sp. MMS24-I2-30]|uniref:DUF4232 domain-containing protein n=1 Tax=Streptomyces sp. MMS24-I2-30 TaxID=3351564 RepID=UPI0038969166